MYFSYLINTYPYILFKYLKNVNTNFRYCSFGLAKLNTSEKQTILYMRKSTINVYVSWSNIDNRNSVLL